MTEDTEIMQAVSEDSADSVTETEPTVRTRSHSKPKSGIAGWLGGLSTPVRWTVIIGVAVAGLLLISVGADAAFSAGRVHPGVKVAGIAVGGMTRAEAAAAIDSGTKPLLDRPVKVTIEASSWDITAAQVGASIDASALAETAYGIGRTGGFGGVVGARITAWLGRENIAAVVTADEVLVSTVLGDIDADVSVPAVDASVEVSGTDVRLIADKGGEGVDHSVARELILKAFVLENRDIELTLVPQAASIREEGARAAYDDALRMVSGPLKLVYDKKTWEVSAKTIGGWLAFRSAGATASAEASSGTLECYLDSAEVSATVVPLVKEVGKVAKDASFKVASGKVTIVPAQDGLGLDAEDLADRLMVALAGTGERTAELPMQRVEAAITTDDAKAMGISTRLSTYTTSYSAGNAPRVNNIHVLADALDGTLVAPGEVFSFNGAIGQRTAEKGYQEANAIVNGVLVPQLGGGICQMGTTVFNAVFFSGLPVVERHNHSLYISHYPKGRDATVSWGGPDFKFRNDTENWILVATAYTSSTVTVSLYGTETGYKVTYNTGPFTNTVAYKVREIKDATLPKGTKVVDEKGVSGRTVVVTRKVTLNGKVVREDTFKSVYKASEEVVRIGTKETKPSTPSTSSP